MHQDLTPLSSDQRYPITLAAEQVTKAGQLFPRGQTSIVNCLNRPERNKEPSESLKEPRWSEANEKVARNTDTEFGKTVQRF